MPTTYTSLLGLALPTTGELSGTWGDTVNDYITKYIDASVAGAQTISGTQTAVTLSTTNGGVLVSAGSGATGSAQYAIINCTGNPAGLLTVTAPAASKVYLILNNTSTSQSVKIVGSGPTTGVTVATAQCALVAWNGSDFELVATTDASKLTGVLATANGGTGLTTFTAANNALYSTSASALTAGTLPVAAGGTGATTLTSNNVILGNGTSAVQFVAPGTSGNVLTSNGTTWASSALPAGGLTYVYKTANYTTQDKEGVLANTTGGAFTVTLPATPATGAQVVVADAGGVWGTNNLTVGRNGSTISNLAENLVCDISGASVQLVYDGTTWEVYAQIGGNGGTAVTLDGVQTLSNKTLVAPIALASSTSTQDGIIVTGRAGGSNSYRATVQPTTLSANRTVTIPDETFTVGFRNIPAVGTKTGSYTLAVGDVGKYVQVGTGGSITIPDATFSEGDVVVIANNTTGNITITCTITTAYIAGTDADKATVTLATRGLANIVFLSGTVCFISGNVT